MTLHHHHLVITERGSIQCHPWWMNTTTRAPNFNLSVDPVEPFIYLRHNPSSSAANLQPISVDSRDRHGSVCAGEWTVAMVAGPWDSDWVTESDRLASVSFPVRHGPFYSLLEALRSMSAPVRPDESTVATAVGSGPPGDWTTECRRARRSPLASIKLSAGTE